MPLIERSDHRSDDDRREAPSDVPAGRLIPSKCAKKEETEDAVFSHVCRFADYEMKQVEVGQGTADQGVNQPCQPKRGIGG